MYAVKPFFDLSFEVKLPDCMYPLNSLTAIDKVQVPVLKMDTEKCSNQGSTNIERKKELICKFDNLLDKLSNVISNKNDDKNPESIKLSAQPIQVKQVHDIVIKASPSKIPYYLLLIKNVWKKDYEIFVKFYLHSNLTTFDENAKKFMESFSKNESEKKTDLSRLRIRFIWIKIDETEMVINQMISVLGTANILRHLSRIGPQHYSYESNENQAFRIDKVLDLCSMLRHQSDFAIDELSSILGEFTMFSTNNRMSIADICALYYLNSSQFQLPNNLKDFCTKFYIL